MPTRTHRTGRLHTASEGVYTHTHRYMYDICIDIFSPEEHAGALQPRAPRHPLYRRPRLAPPGPGSPFPRPSSLPPGRTAAPDPPQSRLIKGGRQPGHPGLRSPPGLTLCPVYISISPSKAGERAGGNGEPGGRRLIPGFRGAFRCGGVCRGAGGESPVPKAGGSGGGGGGGPVCGESRPQRTSTAALLMIRIIITAIRLRAGSCAGPPALRGEADARSRRLPQLLSFSILFFFFKLKNAMELFVLLRSKKLKIRL